MLLFSGAPEPLHRRLVILCHPFPLTIQHGQIVLGAGKILLGGAFIPLQRRPVILRPSAGSIHIGQIILGSNIALFSHEAVPLKRL